MVYFLPAHVVRLLVVVFVGWLDCGGVSRRRRPRLVSCSDFDAYVNAAGEFELHQGVYGLRCRAVDVDQSLER